ncbi:MAG: DUF4034 domain-containing protein [Paracoccaceae bacterium]
MRIFLKLCICLCVAIGTAVAAANKTEEQVFEYAVSGDFEALENVFSQAQERYLAKEISADDMRDLMRPLQSTHPDVTRTLLSWVNADPESAFAHIALAWNIQVRAAQMRGPKARRSIHRDAYSEFNAQNQSAAKHARHAYKLDPDLIPASDAMITMPVYIQGMRDPLLTLRLIMQKHPNWGSLSRGLYAANPGWGGIPQDVQELCDEFAPFVPPGNQINMTLRCYYFGWGKYYTRQAAKWLDETREDAALDSALDEMRVRFIANPWIKSRKTPEDIKFARSFIRNHPQPWDYVDLARRWDRIAPRNSSEDPYLSDEILGNGFVPALARLEKDPLNKTILDFLANAIEAKRMEPNRIELGTDPDLSQLNRMILERRLVAAPYTSQSWLDYAFELSGAYDAADKAKADSAFTNAIYYSTNPATVLRSYLFQLNRRIERWQHYAVLQHAPRQDHQIAERDYILTLDPDADMFCPYLRAFRVYEFECAVAPAGVGNCTKGSGLRINDTDYGELAQEIANRPACAPLMEASYEELQFNQLPVKLPALD